MHAVILISAGPEWRAVRPLFPEAPAQKSDLGEWFESKIAAPKVEGVGPRTGMLRDLGYRVVFFHGGWGKISAAASTQYIIDRWAPPLIINLGTCGGFRGHIEREEIVLVEKTLAYDILERMTDPQAALNHYTTEIDLAWLPAAQLAQLGCKRGILISADRDLIPEDVPLLQQRFGAVAGDWESAAIAWVAARHHTRTLILRGVTDLVGPDGGEAYDGSGQFFAESAARVMKHLIGQLPQWLEIGSKAGPHP